ncbi:hypothetical protein N7G274_002115 [Stereocaulon virgatum]|uniref:Uncharacterized protein n=1 Tax=Stereocaulon virgatum TaxID=373712 RepID=A0ABR4AJQ6_9LECA
MYLTLCLPSWKPKQLAVLVDDDGRERQMVVQLVAIQLLASCFSLLQGMDTMTLPSGWYRQGHQLGENGTTSRFVSSLRQHSQRRHSPAFGHQARNNSADFLWPISDIKPREARLAEQVFHNRVSRHRGARQERSNSRSEKAHEVDHLDTSNSRYRFPSRRHKRLHRSIRRSTTSQIHPQRRNNFPRPTSQCWAEMGRQHSITSGFEDLRHHKIGDEDHACSLEPIVRAERHGVYVQPVKDYVARRWKLLRSRSHNYPPEQIAVRNDAKRLKYQRTIPTTSGESNQISRRTHIVTMIQECGGALGVPPDSPSTMMSSALSGSAMPQPPNSPKSPVEDLSTDAKLQSRISVHRRSQSQSHFGETLVEFPSISLGDQIFEGPMGALDSAQTRNRTSTSGITVYRPRVIAKVFRDTKEGDSNGSTSSSSPRRGKQPFL